MNIGHCVYVRSTSAMVAPATARVDAVCCEKVKNTQKIQVIVVWKEGWSMLRGYLQGNMKGKCFRKISLKRGVVSYQSCLPSGAQKFDSDVMSAVPSPSPPLPTPHPFLPGMLCMSQLNELDGFFVDFQQLVACSMLSALLNEYSSSSRMSSVGFTWEFHMKCKQVFEVSLI